MHKLEVAGFAQIERVEVDFGDLTVIVGPQATGKSLVLQWLKLAIDHREITHALREAGHDVKTAAELLDLTFGQGMSGSWREGESHVVLDGKEVVPQSLVKRRQSAVGRVFFVPAHRALLLAEGWPAPFLKLNADTPVVARLFSQNLYQRFSGRQVSALFPIDRVLKEQYRRVIDDAVFHGGRVELRKRDLRNSLRLSFGEVDLPFMTWTSGQREFTPLLLGLYHLLPPRQIKKRAEVDWVVIEEPEMGLHPQAISVFMLLVLDLMWRGYRVVISTHSPLILDVVWAIRRLAESQGKWQLLCDAFGIDQSASVGKVMSHAMAATFRVFFLSFDPDSSKVLSQDISGLDPESEIKDEATWGGLTGFSSRFGEAVRKAVVDREEV